MSLPPDFDLQPDRTGLLARLAWFTSGVATRSTARPTDRAVSKLVPSIWPDCAHFDSRSKRGYRRQPAVGPRPWDGRGYAARQPSGIRASWQGGRWAVAGVQWAFEPGQIISGTRYRVADLIGVGGMGSVYEVEHVELGKRFVLKALRPELMGRRDLAARLKTEWRALGRLDHPNIVNVTDAGTTDDGVAFYVMERLDGRTLAEQLKKYRRIPPREAVSIACGILEALAAAHTIGVIHRDIKPPNVFLLRNGSVKLLDFGVAKLADGTTQDVTAHGVTLGTPRYLAPEQARGELVDSRADLYAVGLLLFEMIAGHHPFESAKTSNEMVLAHATWPPPDLAEQCPEIPEALDRLVGRLLCKDPNQRPDTALVTLERLRTLYPGSGEVAARNWSGTSSMRVVQAKPSLSVPPEASSDTHVDGTIDDDRTEMRPGLPPDTSATAAGPSGFEVRTRLPGEAQFLRRGSTSYPEQRTMSLEQLHPDDAGVSSNAATSDRPTGDTETRTLLPDSGGGDTRGANVPESVSATRPWFLTRRYLWVVGLLLTAGLSTAVFLGARRIATSDAAEAEMASARKLPSPGYSASAAFRGCTESANGRDCVGKDNQAGPPRVDDRTSPEQRSSLQGPSATPESAPVAPVAAAAAPSAVHTGLRASRHPHVSASPVPSSTSDATATKPIWKLPASGL